MKKRLDAPSQESYRYISRRPFECWSKQKIREKRGKITRYIHEDPEKTCVAADDDISGLLTFIRGRNHRKSSKSFP